MSRVALVALLLLAACDSQPSEKSHATEVRKYLVDAVAEGRVAGAVGVLAQGGELVLEAAGEADREAHVPMRTDTLFRIASMTKPVTSVAVLMLYESGQLELDQPVAELIPSFANVRVLLGDGSRDTLALEGAVTIRHLLTHTSGLTYAFFAEEPLATMYEEAGISDGLVETEGTLGERVEGLTALPLLHQPGQRWSYGLSSDVLGYVVEVVSGMKLDEFMQTRIFQPLGMRDTHFFLSEAEASRLAAVYSWSAADGLLPLGSQTIHAGHLLCSTTFNSSGPRSYLSGGAGLVSTAPDYLRFARLLRGGGVFEGKRLLKEETVRAMTTGQIGDLKLADGSTFGLGVSIKVASDDLGGVGSYGWPGLFYTSFWVDPAADVIGLFFSQLLVVSGDRAEPELDFARAVYSSLASE